MNHIISKEKMYIPQFNGNQDLPSSEKIIVKYKAATIDLKNKTISKPVAVGEFDEAGNTKGMKVELKTNDDAYLKNMITEISGLTYQESEDSEVKHIKTASDLLKAPIFYEPLCQELIELCRNELEGKGAVNAKN